MMNVFLGSMLDDAILRPSGLYVNDSTTPSCSGPWNSATIRPVATSQIRTTPGDSRRSWFWSRTLSGGAKLPVAIRRPSGLKSRQVTGTRIFPARASRRPRSGPRRGIRNRSESRWISPALMSPFGRSPPAAASQIFSMPSTLTVAINSPSGLNSAPHKALVCPSRGAPPVSQRA